MVVNISGFTVYHGLLYMMDYMKDYMYVMAR